MQVMVAMMARRASKPFVAKCGPSTLDERTLPSARCRRLCNCPPTDVILGGVAAECAPWGRDVCMQSVCGRHAACSWTRSLLQWPGKRPGQVCQCVWRASAAWQPTCLRRRARLQTCSAVSVCAQGHTTRAPTHTLQAEACACAPRPRRCCLSAKSAYSAEASPWPFAQDAINLHGVTGPGKRLFGSSLSTS
jgi:hypothetical protein